MKKYIIAVIAATLCVGAYTAHAGMFDNGEKERRIQIEQELVQQQHQSGEWQGIAFILGLATVGTLITGTIIGSRAKKAANKNKEVPNGPKA